MSVKVACQPIQSINAEKKEPRIDDAAVKETINQIEKLLMDLRLFTDNYCNPQANRFVTYSKRTAAVIKVKQPELDIVVVEPQTWVPVLGLAVKFKLKKLMAAVNPLYSAKVKEYSLNKEHVRAIRQAVKESLEDNSESHLKIAYALTAIYQLKATVQSKQGETPFDGAKFQRAMIVAMWLKGLDSGT